MKVEKFDPFDRMTFTYDKCFLCGDDLNAENTSEEHVYPKWLQNKFNLWNQRLDLLNKTTIKYKDLKIPCCKKCNGTMSALFEKPIERAVEQGYDEFVKLDKDKIFLWLNKLSYGMLFKELSLSINRAHPEDGTICDEEYLSHRKMQYKFLQSILSEKIEFSGKPYSMLIFKIKPGEHKYWAFDNPFTQTFFIRMNDIGIVTHLMDNAYNENFFYEHPDMLELLNKPLHPIQFAEICAKFQYKVSLFIRTPSYILSLNEDKKPHFIFSQQMGGIGYTDWSQKDYAKVLAFFLEAWGVNLDDIYQEPDLVLSFLRNEDGTFKEISENLLKGE